MKVIDTRRNTQAGGTLSHASNRIYICEPCATECGEAIGLVKRAEFESVVDKLRDADLKLKRTEEDLEEARTQQTRVLSLADVVATLNASPAQSASPAPRPKTTPAKRVAAPAE